MSIINVYSPIYKRVFSNNLTRYYPTRTLKTSISTQDQQTALFMIFAIFDTHPKQLIMTSHAHSRLIVIQCSLKKVPFLVVVGQCYFSFFFFCTSISYPPLNTSAPPHVSRETSIRRIILFQHYVSVTTL